MKTNAVTHLVQVNVGPMWLGLDMDRVLGIERADRLKPSPDNPELAGKLTNRAGEWPVLDLAIRLGLPKNPPSRAGQIILTAICGERYGLLVDRAAPVPQSEAENVRPLPRSLVRSDTAFDRVLIQSERPLLLLNPDRLSQTVDLFADDFEPLRPDFSQSTRRAQSEHLVILGQYEYPLPGGRIFGFGIPLNCVAEIIEAPGGSIVPGAADCVRELSSWHDRPLPIIDLATWCGMRVPQRALRRTAVIRLPHGERVGFPVGNGVRLIPLPIPNIPARRTHSIQTDRTLGVFDTNEQTIVIPDLDQLTRVI